MDSNEYHTGCLNNPNPKFLGFSNSNFNNRFDAGESRLSKIQAKISVEDFEYLKGFANSNKRIDENDPRLAKIRAKISEEDVRYLKGLANSNFKTGLGANNNRGLAKANCCGGRPGDPGTNVVVDVCVIL